MWGILFYLQQCRPVRQRRRGEAPLSSTSVVSLRPASTITTTTTATAVPRATKLSLACARCRRHGLHRLYALSCHMYEVAAAVRPQYLPRNFDSQLNNSIISCHTFWGIAVRSVSRPVTNFPEIASSATPTKRQRDLPPPSAEARVTKSQKRDRSQDLKHKWSCFKRQAQRRGIEQRLSFEQYPTLVQLPCAYCGKGAVGQRASFVGIDRIDSNAREYSLQNCVPSCSVCNFMKGALDANVFLNKVREIAAWRTGSSFDTEPIIVMERSRVEFASIHDVLCMSTGDQKYNNVSVNAQSVGTTMVKQGAGGWPWA